MAADQNRILFSTANLRFADGQSRRKYPTRKPAAFLWLSAACPRENALAYFTEAVRSETDYFDAERLRFAGTCLRDLGAWKGWPEFTPNYTQRSVLQSKTNNIALEIHDIIRKRANFYKALLLVALVDRAGSSDDAIEGTDVDTHQDDGQQGRPHFCRVCVERSRCCRAHSLQRDYGAAPADGRVLYRPAIFGRLRLAYTRSPFYWGSGILGWIWNSFTVYITLMLPGLRRRSGVREVLGTMAERLARPPPTKANRVQSPTGSPDFRKWESCRTMPLVGGFSRGSPVYLAPSFRRHSIFTSITLIGSQDLAVKRRPNIFTHFDSTWGT
ncbi:hypothetical protein PR048_014481 [Dryococelus australis]|uniref:Uncharacterized protein n=1 Tax=Dryococelus australis TaxID=614101 RepID=A0ABQ9HEI9_9NEOP|nr:hypothetical protein PR048_014481 [Dryococelus australis]